MTQGLSEQAHAPMHHEGGYDSYEAVRSCLLKFREILFQQQKNAGQQEWSTKSRCGCLTGGLLHCKSNGKSGSYLATHLAKHSNPSPYIISHYCFFKEHSCALAFLTPHLAAHLRHVSALVRLTPK